MHVDLVDVLLAAVVLTCAFCVVFPYALYPLSLKSFRRQAIDLPPAVDQGLRYALLFCAHNEERALPATIDNLRIVKRTWPELEILAYSDCSSDDTFRILQSASDVLTAFEGRERAGKPAGMAKLVKATNADIVIFMDANVLVDAATIRTFERYFSSPDIGSVAGTLKYINEDASAVASVGGLYWRIEEKIKQLETATGSTMGADGSLFAMRRKFYPAVRSDLQDDFLASMEGVFRGLRCVSAPDILAYEAAAVGSGTEFRRKRRIACGAFSSHRHIWPRVRQLDGLNFYKYLSHKLIRWFGAFFLAIGFLAAWWLAARHDLGVVFIALAAVVVLIGALAVRLGVRPVVKVYEILAAIVATGIGVVESLAGAKYAIWKPPER